MRAGLDHTGNRSTWGNRFFLVFFALMTMGWSAAAQNENSAGGEPADVESEAQGEELPSDNSRKLTKEQVEALKVAREVDLELMVGRTRDFREVVDGMVRRVYEMQRLFINESYAKSLKDEEVLSGKARQTAIEFFEKFLRKYPDNPEYTPDAMYRLAELYYDDSYIRYQNGLERYADAQEKGVEEGVEIPEKEFGKTIQILGELIEKYPTYRSIDGAYYVVGYCLNDTGREKEARLAWLNLVCANKYQYHSAASAGAKKGKGESDKHRPSAFLETGVEAETATAFVDPFQGCEPVTANSRFFFEAWWFVGNYHFDYDLSKYGVETAIAAYRKLVSDSEHKFYDKGLYKLAWSYFKADMYPEAIAAFSQVVDFSDSQKAGRGSGMRPEAIQYLAVCFFTEDWDLDMMPDPETGLERLQNPKYLPQDRTWTREVYERLGDIYSDNEKNADAIAAWKLSLEAWPLDVKAPFIQEKIALEYGKMRMAEEEIAARSALEGFAPGSAWWRANTDHPVEQNEVSRMTRDALLEAAYHFHRMAQNARQRGLAAQDAGLLERAITTYNLAAGAYKKFIEQNPDTPDAYDISFNLAETLFWSGQYEEARAVYMQVRDSNLDDKHFRDAGYMVLVSSEEMLKRQIENGNVVPRKRAPDVQETEPPSVASMPIPPILLELVAEKEAFIKDNQGHEETAKFRYQSAQTYYRYGHWDEAKKRYQQLYDDYCKTDAVAYISWQTMMNMAVDLNDLDEKEKLALLQKERDCSAEGIEEIIEAGEAIDIETVLGDVAMQRSLTALKACMAEKKVDICSGAGDDLVAAVTKAPDHPDADKALHNAALAYEIAQRFDSAMKLYGRIVQEYPQSEFVGKCLFQQASAANNFFEYDKALENYRILADEKRFKDYENRTVAVYNAAYILTNLQSYTAAIPYWERYSKEEKDEQKSIEAAFNASDMYFRAKKWVRAIRAYNEFINRYERSEAAGPFVVKAAYRIGLAIRKTRPKRRLLKEWNRTVELYNRLVRTPGSMSAEYAAKSHFMIIEQDMRTFEKFKIRGSQKTIDRKIKEGAEQVKDLETRYRQIQKYRRPAWSLAAEFRIGYAFEVYAKALLNILVPPLDRETQKLLKQLPSEDRELVMIEYEDKFRAAMEEYVAGAEEKAQSEYKIAVELARKGNISNAWTLKALERMNAYDPDNFPRQHNGIIEVEDATLTAPPWAAEVKR